MFSNSTKYAIRAVLFLSRNRATDQRAKVEDIAKELDIPKAFLSKILQQLAKNKLVSSAKGRGGGFYLSDANIHKSLMDIIICIEGHNIFDKCILGLPNCCQTAPCYLHEYYQKYKEGLSTIIKDATISELIVDDTKNNYKL